MRGERSRETTQVTTVYAIPNVHAENTTDDVSEDALRLTQWGKMEID